MAIHLHEQVCLFLIKHIFKASKALSFSRKRIQAQNSTHYLKGIKPIQLIKSIQMNRFPF